MRVSDDCCGRKSFIGTSGEYVVHILFIHLIEAYLQCGQFIHLS